MTDEELIAIRGYVDEPFREVYNKRVALFRALGLDAATTEAALQGLAEIDDWYGLKSREAHD